jgi:amino acid transporter
LDPSEPTKLPLEARDFGIYAGFLVTWLYLNAIGRGRAKGMPQFPLMLCLVAFVLIMGADGVNAFMYDLKVLPHLYTPILELRLATGLMCGVAFGGIMTPVVNHSLWRESDPRPVFGTWKQFLGALGLMALLFVLNYSGIGLFLWPLSILASGATIVLIAMINMVFVISLAGKEGTAVTWRDVLNPFAVGVVLAIVELGVLSLVRFAVLGTAVLP